jgi:hypothetical protein
MPQLTVRGIGVETMAAVSRQLVQELAHICECGEDNFTCGTILRRRLPGISALQALPKWSWHSRCTGKKLIM